MIDEHRILKLECVGGGSVEFEVNFSNNEKIKDCQIIKIKKDKIEFEIKRDDLVNLLLIIGNEKNQKDLLPTTKIRVKQLERLLTFDWKATRDYKQGEIITVQAPWIDTLKTTEEVLAGNNHIDKQPLKFFIK